ncbi:UNVERIFIED_CONTAM: hypothetical protein O8I53_10160 [Campylobacter lari]
MINSSKLDIEFIKEIERDFRELSMDDFLKQCGTYDEVMRVMDALAKM